MNSSPSLTHARAAAGMVLVTLMWSTAGVVSRSLQAAESFEVTFFRSLFKRSTGVTPANYRAHFAPLKVRGEMMYEAA